MLHPFGPIKASLSARRAILQGRLGSLCLSLQEEDAPVPRTSSHLDQRWMEETVQSFLA